MGFKVYILTFSGMTMLYTLRAAYSYARPYIMKEYHMNNLFISFVDAAQFGGQATGFLLKYKLFSNTYSIS